MHIQDTLREYYTKTKGAKRAVAEFLIANFDDIPMLTLDEASLKIGVSLSTITRTTSEMGFHGFPDFQKQVWTSVKARLTPSARMGLAAPRLAAQTCNESLQQDIESVVLASNLNLESNFDQAASLIAEASKVYILGIRTASTLSSFSFYALSKIRSHVYNLDFGSALEHIEEMKEGSVLFVASFPRYSTFTADIARIVCGQGGSVIGLTDSPSSPLAPCSKVVLYAPYESVSFFNSMVAPLSVLNVLIVKINAILGEAGKNHLIQYEELLGRWGVLVEPRNKLKNGRQ